MSLWLNKLRPASFRGEPFFLLEDPDISVGRRLANHEYAGRDTPYSEDVGRKQRSYTISGGLDGDDFIEKANRLIDACEQKGAGLLVHPFLGELIVTVEARFTFQGRFASFQMTATEAGDNSNPSRSSDTRSIVIDKAATAESTSIDAFIKQYDVTGPGFIREQALASVSNVLSQIQSFGALINTDDVSKTIDSSQALSRFLFESVSLAFNTANQTLAEVLTVFLPENTDVARVGASRRKALENELAIRRLVYESIVIDAAKKIRDFNFVTQSDAVKRVGEIANGIDRVILESNDDTYKVLTDLRIAIQQDMQERLPSLPTLNRFTVVQPTPSLVVAYRYGSGIESEPEIVARNNFLHPGFIRGDIEVINESSNV